MKIKLLTVILSLMLCMTAVPVIAADDAEGSSTEASEKTVTEEHPPRLVDDADLLRSDQEELLTEKLDRISSEGECDVAIVTVNSLGDKTSTEFADDFYDYSGYGMGDSDDGIMLVISIEERDWAITAHAFGIYAFTDAGQEYIMNKVTPLLIEGEYDGAFNKFADQCDDFIIQARNGEPYDSGSLPKWYTTKTLFFWIIPCLIASAVISSIHMRREKRNLRNVKRKAGARDYAGGTKLTAKSDRFLYKTVTRTLIVDDDELGNSGSSTHISSSGEVHGGSSGKF